jgi:1,2-diacylglycerol 3-alpha-glucosyltransferase
VGPGRPLKVFLTSVFLGTYERGLESFTRDLYGAIRGAPDMEVTLFRGGGAPAEEERVVRLIDYRWRLSQAAARRVGRAPEKAEEFGFGLRLAPTVLRERPDIVFVSDRAVGHVLHRVRQATGARFRILLHNGSPVGAPYGHWDHVHQTAPPYYDTAITAGESPTKHTLLPLPSNFPPGWPLRSEDIAALRRRLSLPQTRPLLLSVGAVNGWHKRMDYVVSEVAGLHSDERPFLLLLGQTDWETAEILGRAESLLGASGFAHRTVPAAEVHDYYRAADLFTLASLTEGFGRVYVEALGHGLPCLVDDNRVTRYVLGNDADFGDFARPGSLARLVQERLSQPLTLETRMDRARRTRERYSWERLGPAYLDMIRRAARAPSDGLRATRVAALTRVKRTDSP